MLGAEVYQIAVLVILILGIYNVMTAKNIVKIILILEMMLTSVNLLLLHASVINGEDPLGSAVIITSIVIGAGLTAFLLSLAIKVGREHGTIDIQKLNSIKE